MSPAGFRAIGGMVIADHGPLALAEARRLVAFYLLEGAHNLGSEHHGVAEACAARSVTLREAITSAEEWRRAAGWAEPDLADR